MTPVHQELLKELRDFARNASTAQVLMEHVTKRLHEKMTRYNWVGFYLVDPADANYLIVGPFTGQVVVVPDVSADPRYLPGSSLVKSEIVVPIFADKKLVAELDIESYFVDAFPFAERVFVESCAKVVADYLGKT